MDKWFIADNDNIKKVQTGDYPGLKDKIILNKYL